MKNNSRNSSTSKLSTIFSILILGLCFSVKVFAAPGDIDRSFGIDGFSKTPIGASTDEVSDSTIQPDGKIIVVGSTRNGTFYDFFVTRFNINGTLDSSFDGDGKVITSLSNRDDFAAGIALQSDGKIIVVGTTTVGDTNDPELAIIRYNTDGSLDTSFDGDGIVITTSTDSGYDASVLPDGKILVLGRASSSTAVFRYNSNGSVDTTFGINGRVTIFISGFQLNLQRLAIQQDGKILLAGINGFGGTNYHFAVVRLNQNGTLDTSFDNDGIVVTKVNSSPADQDAGRAILIQGDNKIVVVGDSNSGLNTFFDFAAVRYNSDGSLDSTFDADGKVIIPFGNNYDSANAVALQADGKLILAGNTIINSDSNFALARLNTNGSLDSTFGNNGKVITFVPPGRSVIRGVDIQSDGKIVVAGDFSAAVGSSNTDVVLVRYQVKGIREADFDGDKLSDISVFRPTDGVWYLLRSQSGFSATQFGISTDKITPADFDGDGRTDIAVYRGGTWYLQRSLLGFTGVAFGESNDIPVPADYDGDGKADLAVFRPSNGVWYLLQSTAGFTGIQFGQSGDKPVAADYDGDGKADVAVYRAGIWYIQRSQLEFTGIQFGDSNDKPVPTDYDGDGKSDVAVFRPSNGTWYFQQSTAGFTGIAFGLGTDLPTPADYDGDGKSDVAVFRNGTWYLQRSQAGFTGVSFGALTDKPIPNAFVP